MKKLIVQIHQQRFELESNGSEKDALILATAQELANKIEILKRQHGFPDSVRATALAALLIALEAKNSDNAVILRKEDKEITVLNGKIEKTLTRTAGSPAKAFTQ